MKKKPFKITKKIDEYCSWQWLLAAVAVAMFACSQSMFLDIWNRLVVPLLVFDIGWQFTVIVVLLLIHPGYVLVKRWRKYIYDDRKIFLFIVFLSVYIYFRIENHQAFAMLWRKFAYADIPSIMILVFFIESIVNFCWQGRTKKTNSVLVDDDPIVDLKSDELNRKSFVPEISQKIVNLNTENFAQTFGIIAPWGAGKTSFINLLKEDIKALKEYKDHKIKIVDFYPWHIPGTEDLAERFFQLLSSELSKDNIKLSHLVKVYADWLTGNDKGSWISNLFALRSEPEVLSFDKICTFLKTGDTKYIIFIDDIDRLEGTEILEVFKLIRGSANFPHLVFVIAFDKNYVQDALQQVSPAMNGDYIKKFFNIEFHLPSYDNEALVNLASELSRTFLEGADYDDFMRYLAPKQALFQDSPVEHFISTPRALKRWINSIQIEYKFLKGECDVENLADINLLKQNYSFVYDALKYQHDIFLISVNNRYVLFDKENPDSGVDYSNSITTMNKRELWKESELVGMGENDKCRLKVLLHRLFPASCNLVNPKSVCEVFYFNRYFYDVLQFSDISDREFDKLKKSSVEEMKIYVQESIKHKALALQQQLKRYTPTSSQEAENILHMVFYAGWYYSSYVINSDTVYDILESYSSDKGKKKSLIDRLFTENGASSYVSFLLHVTSGSNCMYSWDDYLSSDEKQTYAVKMLQFAVDENMPKVDIDSFYRRTETLKPGMSGRRYDDYKTDKRALKIMRKVHHSRPEEFFPFLIEVRNASIVENKSEWILSHMIQKIWGNWPEFEKDLGLLPKTPIVDEFREFYQKSKSHSYEPIEFEFKVLHK